jgi:hypothetical protein
LLSKKREKVAPGLFIVEYTAEEKRRRYAVTPESVRAVLP